MKSSVVIFPLLHLTTDIDQCSFSSTIRNGIFLSDRFLNRTMHQTALVTPDVCADYSSPSEIKSMTSKV